MFSVTTLIFLSTVIVLIAGALYIMLRSNTGMPREDDYIRGLEYWLEGNLPAAILAMKSAAEVDRRSVEPYLQLGNLLRINGDSSRAANIHRSLGVRPGLSRGQKRAITLSLVEDLLILGEWAEAAECLDSVDKQARQSQRYWRSRFRQLDRSDEKNAAARSLKEAAKQLAGDEGRLFADYFELYQLDRAMHAIGANRSSEVQGLLKSLPANTRHQDLIHFISASASLANGDMDQASEKATEGLLKHPELSDLLLPVLQKALMASGQFNRTIPILESAVRGPGAPITLVMTLALLYEKIGDRELALDLIASRTGDQDLSPDVAAGYLRILLNDLPDSDFSRVWSCLHLPDVDKVSSCGSCRITRDHVGWYCPSCGAFDKNRITSQREISP